MTRAEDNAWHDGYEQGTKDEKQRRLDVLFDDARVKQGTKDEKQRRLEDEGARRKLQRVASALGFEDFGDGFDVLGELFKLRALAAKPTGAT